MTNLLISFLYCLPLVAAGYGIAYAIDAVRNRFSTQKAAK